MKSIKSALALSLALACTPLAHTQTGVTSTTVFRTGDPIPGMPGFTFSINGGLASINDAGTIIANARLDGPDVTLSNADILVAADNQGLHLIARANDTATATTLPDYIYRSSNINVVNFNDLTVASDNTFAFNATLLRLSTSTFGHDAMFVGNTTAHTPVLYETGPAPNFPASSISAYFTPFIYRTNGSVAYIGRASPANANVVWFGTQGNMNASLQTGLQAPELPIGINISSFGQKSLSMDGFGRLLFQATLPLGSGITQSNRSILYFGEPNNLGIIARTNEPVPGFPNTTFTNFVVDSLRINNLSAIAYQAFLSSPSADEAIITGVPGNFTVLAKDTDPIPSLPGFTIDRVARSRIQLNSLGHVAFAARIVGAPGDANTAIFIGDPTGFRIVLREGAPLPGGGTIGDLAFDQIRWSFNDRDQIVLITSTENANVLIATRPDGSIIELVRTGTLFSTDDGFSGIPAAFSVDFEAGTTDSGRSSYFNSSGELVVSIRMGGTAGQGVVRFDIDNTCPADLALPFNTLDANDTNTAINLVQSSNPAVDENNDTNVDFFDLSTHLNFYATCTF